MFKLVVTVILACFLIFAGCATQRTVGPSGSATASAQGFYGPVTVTVTMENGRIVRVEADGPYETPGIGTRALIQISARMVERNTVNVDTLSGSTVTADAVIEAAKAAVAQIR